MRAANRPPLKALYVPIEALRPRRAQPRARFDEQRLDELAVSLREVGMLEPILARECGGGEYEIVAGERRWRAAQRAGLHEVPVWVRELTDEATFEAALIENIQREDLSPIEMARAFKHLSELPGATQKSVAERMGKDLSTVSNTIRLLKLPPAVLELVDAQVLSEGHGRALLSAREPALIEALALEAVERGWSVRETERRARGGGTAPIPRRKSANVRDLEERIQRALNTRVEVDDHGGAGTVSIRFGSYAELDRLLDEALLRPKPD